jgi:putative transposase
MSLSVATAGNPSSLEPGDYQAYLRWLQAGAERYECAVHAYVLMSNPVHVLASPNDAHSVGRALQ